MEVWEAVTVSMLPRPETRTNSVSAFPVSTELRATCADTWYSPMAPLKWGGLPTSGKGLNNQFQRFRFQRSASATEGEDEFCWNQSQFLLSAADIIGGRALQPKTFSRESAAFATEVLRFLQPENRREKGVAGVGDSRVGSTVV